MEALFGPLELLIGQPPTPLGEHPLAAWIGMVFQCMSMVIKEVATGALREGQRVDDINIKLIELQESIRAGHRGEHQKNNIRFQGTHGH